jgi:hypothetical protein
MTQEPPYMNHPDPEVRRSWLDYDRAHRVECEHGTLVILPNGETMIEPRPLPWPLEGEQQ